MASFKSVLQVKGRQYTVLYSDFDIHQFTDSLGRPASPTFGGVYTLDVESPPSGDSTLFEWMVEPTLFLNGQVLIKNLTGTTLKVIKFYNAYCVDLEQHFDGIGRSGDQSSLRLSLRISPQAVKIGEQFHDNNWPAPEPIVDWHWADMDAQSNPKPQAKEPSALSEGLHTVLDVVGMIPVVGEVADAANAAIYAAEGDYTNAALSAASMVPIAGNIATVGRWAKKFSNITDASKYVEKSREFFKQWHLRTDADPVRDILGPGKLSHPEEWQNTLDKLHDAGVEIKYRKDLAYGPGIPGKPGQLLISEEASISALRHEYQHFLDDKAMGFPGAAKLLSDPKLRWKMEYDAYMQEVKMMRQIREFDTAKKLLDNARAEKLYLENFYGVTL